MAYRWHIPAIVAVVAGTVAMGAAWAHNPLCGPAVATALGAGWAHGWVTSCIAQAPR